MNKSELVKKLAEETGRTETEAKKMITAFVSIVENTLKSGEPVTLIGFGTFHPVVQPGRMVRNPKTGVPLEMSPRNNVRFKTGILFLRYLNPDQKLK